MGQCQCFPGFCFLRKHHLHGTEPVAAVTDEPFHKVHILEPCLGFIADPEIHHVHMRLFPGFHFSPADFLRMSLMIFSARIYPVAMMRSGNPSAFQYDRDLEVPFGSESLFPFFVISRHSESIMTKAVSFADCTFQHSLGIRIRLVVPPVHGLFREHPVIVHQQRNIGEVLRIKVCNPLIYGNLILSVDIFHGMGFAPFSQSIGIYEIHFIR